MKDRTMLVLEDEIPLLKVIKKKLESYSCEVITARSVSQGLHYLEELERVDAIWLDHYLLGKSDGLDFVSQVKHGDSKWRKIPIFLVSNTASDDKIQSYIKLGVNRYYAKASNSLETIIDDIKKSLK